MTSFVTVSAPASGQVRSALAINGTVGPAGDSVQIQLSNQNVTLPTGPWSSTITVAGVFNGALTPSSAGVWYVWAYDPTTGAQAVSGSITVSSGAAALAETTVPVSTLAAQAAALVLQGACVVLPFNGVPSGAPPATSAATTLGVNLNATSGATVFYAYVAGAWVALGGAGSDTSFTLTALTALVAGLPTTLPSTVGTLWLDGGVVALTDGGTADSFTTGTFTLANFTALLLSLPTTLPSTGGVPWLNDGLVTLTDGGAPGTYTSGTLSLANFTLLLLSLPTSLPSTDGTLWLNDGLLTLTN